jgi:hypothetical protein
MMEVSSDSAFLVRPLPKGTESIRSLLNRLMQENKLSPRFIGEPKGLGHSTDTALALAKSAGWDRENLLKRGALVHMPGFAHGTISIGVSRIGKRCFVGSQRRICPHCIGNSPETPLSWEIFINRACHLHRCLLVDKCSGCQAPLDWLALDHACSSCGLPWSRMTTQQAPRWSLKLSKWIHISISRSIRELSEDGMLLDGQLRMRLDKLLLMIDVLRHVLLRRWLSAEIWDRYNLHWTVELLKSPDYRFWLWHATFLHAAKDPMTLAKALVPSGTGLYAASFFDNLGSNAPVPAFILDSLKLLRERRTVRKLLKLEIFDPRLHGIRPSMQVMSGYQYDEYRAHRVQSYLHEFDFQALEDEETGMLVSPC